MHGAYGVKQMKTKNRTACNRLQSVKSKECLDFKGKATSFHCTNIGPLTFF